MHLYSVYDKEFRPYGKILKGYDTSELVAAMNKIPLPECGTDYKPSIDSLEACGVFSQLGENAFGGMPVQLGMCWGKNTKLNALEYHRNSELNIGASDFVVLLAKAEDIVNGKLDSSAVKGFSVPAGVVCELYATTLHYAPCHIDEKNGFRVAVVLPKGTNTNYSPVAKISTEDRMLLARNKWVIAHPDSSEADSGAYVGIEGKNIDISLKNPVAKIEIENFGNMTVELYPDDAPITVDNFIKLASDGFYDGLIFHRVISGFMIQGGDPEGTGMGGPGYSIKGEFQANGISNPIKHERGVISMARSRHPDSAGSQFFIMHQDSPHLDGQYAAFGKVTSGIEVVDAIASSETDYNDKPLKPVRITRIIIE